eukprot:g3348.t1
MTTLVKDCTKPLSNCIYIEDRNDGTVDMLVPSFCGHRCTFKREADEPAQKTLHRIASTFQKKLRKKLSKNMKKAAAKGEKQNHECPMLQVLLQTSTRETLPAPDLLDISLQHALRRYKYLLVTGIPENKACGTECSFELLRNLPSVKHVKCFIKRAPVATYPLAPIVALEFATECSFQWTADDTIVGRDPVFVPRPEHTGMRLSLIVTPIPNAQQATASCSSGSSSGTAHSNRIVRSARLDFTHAIQGLPEPLSKSTMPWKKRATAELDRAKNRILTRESVIRIMSYNILADVYLRLSPPGHLIHTPTIYAMDYRQNLILDEILTCECDVIALQECEKDFFDQFLLPQLRYRGFDGIFCSKRAHSDEIGMPSTAEGCEGCAMFWRTGSLELCHSCCVPLSALAKSRWSTLAKFFKLDLETKAQGDLAELIQIGSVLQLCAFRIVSADGGDIGEDDTQRRNLIVGNTHLYHHHTGETIRALQAILVSQECESFRDRCGLPKVGTGVVIAGDFNATPETFTVQTIRNGILSPRMLSASGNQSDSDGAAGPTLEGKLNGCESSHKRGNLPVQWAAVDWEVADSPSLANELDGCALTHDNRFASCYDAYLMSTGTEFPLTTYSLEFDGTLDWVFFSSRTLRMLRLWDMYPPETLARPALPSEVFPSDHIAVVVDLAFKI